MFVGLAIFSIIPIDVSAVEDIIPGNLILNPSLEVATLTTPDNWETSTYQNNTAIFTYPVEGANGVGSKAARVDISNYTSGDSKWAFEIVKVNPNSDYIYKNSYRSNVPTHIMIGQGNGAVPSQFTYTDGVPVVAASPSSWKEIGVEIHTLNTTEWLVVYHLLESNGWLEIDNTSLVPVSSVGVTDLVPNNSLEEISVNPDTPRAWLRGGFGNNTRTYEYINNDGHTGSKSVKFTVTNYVDGDANWVFSPQPLTPGGDYRFTAWYKSSTGSTPRVVARFLDGAGNATFFGLPNPFPGASSATVWQEYSSEFFVPMGSVGVQVFFILRENGWIQSDDYHITPYTFSGFNRPLITLTFDDITEGNIINALPVLENYDFDTTHCFNTRPLIVGDESPASVNTLFNAGHEICSHTITHPFLTEISPAQVAAELSEPQAYLENLIGGTPVTSFSSPFGDYNAAVIDQINDYYRAHRTVDEGYNSRDNLNVYRLRVQNMRPTTTLSQFQEWVNKAKEDKTWLILVYHGIIPAGAEFDTFDTHKADFDTQMSWLNGQVFAGNIAVKRLDHAIVEVTTIVPPATDTIPPIITLTGSATINLNTGETYTEQGATATDNIDGAVVVAIGGDTVNTGAVGTYRITYNAIDAALNQAVEIVRTVIVSAPTLEDSGGSSGGGGGSSRRRNTSNTNSSQVFTIFDFNTLIIHWGEVGPNNPADFNNDNVVDIFDFNLLIVNWK